MFVEHFPPFLGSDKSIFEFTKRIVNQGVSVHFIVTQPLRYLLGNRPKNWVYKDQWLDKPPHIHKRISARYLYVNQMLELLWRIFMPLAYFLTIISFVLKSIKELIKFNPDLVVSAHASPIVGATAFTAARLTRNRFAMGCPDWMSAYAAGLVKEKMTSLGPSMLQLLEFRLYRWADGVFASTEYLARLLRNMGVDEDTITVIPNGVDIDLFNPTVNSDAIKKKYRLENRCVILFSGHLEDWAGVDLIHTLAERLNKDAPDSTILLVGAGASMSMLFDRLFRDNLGHLVTHAGYHPFEMMPKFTAASDITLCIFPDTPVAHAASPLKLFEYLGAGKAVVATSVSGTMDVLNSTTGFLIKPGDTQGICDAVIRLSKDSQLRDEFGRKGRILVEKKYSWDELSLKFFKMCQKIVSNQ
ncbi:MAG: glycosyltransferase family 4 protein [Candidatus Thorarchaeota archaeon]